MNKNSPIKEAANYVYKENIKYWSTFKIYLPKKKREYATLICAYLIWIDNVIDGTELTVTEKKKFISDQIKFIDLLIYGEKPIPLSKEQKYLLFFYKYCLAINKKDFIYDINNIVKALNWDVERLEMNGIFREKELEKYMITLLKATFNLHTNLLLPEKDQYYNDAYIGEFFWHLANARDFREDLKAGYINISKEDFIKYNLNLNNIFTNKNLNKWFHSKIPILMGLLKSEAKILSKMQFKIKLIWFAAYTFYLPQFFRIQLYGYGFGIKPSKKYIKELNVYFSSLVIAIKQFQRIFLT
jgi:hypothetical protein